LPQPLVKRVGWITGDQPIEAWLLMGSPARCRLLSTADVEKTPEWQSALYRISALDEPTSPAIEFDDDASVGLALRLAPVQITPPKPGWRVTLPRMIAAIMRIRPEESDLAALFLNGYIEFWTMEAIRSSITVPLVDVL